MEDGPHSVSYWQKQSSYFETGPHGIEEKGARAWEKTIDGETVDKGYVPFSKYHPLALEDAGTGTLALEDGDALSTLGGLKNATKLRRRKTSSSAKRSTSAKRRRTSKRSASKRRLGVRRRRAPVYKRH